MYQNEPNNNPKEPLQLKRPPDKKYTKNRVGVDIQYCAKVEDKSKKKLSLKVSDVSELGTEYKDIFWVLGCMNFKNSEKNPIPGTWNAFNSLISTKSVLKKMIQMVPPLIREPPTNYNILYTGLMKTKNIAQKVNGEEELIVVTLDMQLYGMTIKLWCIVNSISQSFLHVMF